MINIWDIKHLHSKADVTEMLLFLVFSIFESLCESFHYLTWFHLTDVFQMPLFSGECELVKHQFVEDACFDFRRSSWLVCSQQVNTQPQFPLNTERISLVAIKRPPVNLSNSQATTPGQSRPLLFHSVTIVSITTAHWRNFTHLLLDSPQNWCISQL